MNRGFVVTLLVLSVAAEALLRALASAPPPAVRLLYGTTLGMYMEVADRLRARAPHIEVLATGDSLALMQFQPDVYAGAIGAPADAVFNAAYLGSTFRSQEHLLRSIGLDRLARLRQAILFVNPRRLTSEGNSDADLFRVAIPDPDGPWHEARRERRIAPLLDYSRLYGLSRYLVTASWRQVRNPPSWDRVELLGPQGGVAFEGTGAGGTFPYAQIGAPEPPFITDLKRVMTLFLDRGVAVTLSTNVVHRTAVPFASDAAGRAFESAMAQLARETGSRWVPMPSEWRPPSESDFLDYGHLNRSGGEAFTVAFAKESR